jgi:ATP phosphoribosyltransferase regulatory subunit
VTQALARKDEVELREHAGALGLPHASALCDLLRLHGGRDAIVDGARLLAGTPAAPAVARLLALFDAVVALGLAPAVVRADLAEVRGFAYYTGTIFHLYAHGPGEPIGAGGRYDELLGRFGVPMPSVGFALDLDSVASALRAANAAPEAEARVVVVGTAADPRLVKLRATGIAAVALEDGAAALAYARAWGFTHLLDHGSLVDVTSGATSTLGPDEALASLVAARSNRKGV